MDDVFGRAGRGRRSIGAAAGRSRSWPPSRRRTRGPTPRFPWPRPAGWPGAASLRRSRRSTGDRRGGRRDSRRCPLRGAMVGFDRLEQHRFGQPPQLGRSRWARSAACLVVRWRARAWTRVSLAGAGRSSGSRSPPPPGTRTASSAATRTRTAPGAGTPRSTRRAAMLELLGAEGPRAGHGVEQERRARGA